MRIMRITIRRSCWRGFGSYAPARPGDAPLAMAVNIPTELLRSFVAVIETGSILQATERVFVTQSAISLQMRRLEEIIRQPLFNRHGRKLRLTPAGEHLLSTARQI